MNILVVCGGGISTSILVEKMKDYANKDDKIKATSLDHLKHYINNTNVGLVAPQVSFAKENLQTICKQKNIPMFTIDKHTYGNMDGNKVMKDLKNNMKHLKSNNNKRKYTIAFFCTLSFPLETLIAKLQTDLQDKEVVIEVKKHNNDISKLNSNEDLIVLIPQTRYLYDELKEKYDERKIYYIDLDAYAFLNLDKIAHNILVKLNIEKEEM